MVYVNYLTLSLVAVTAVLFASARYVLVDEERPETREANAYVAGAGGLIMAVTGLHLALTWPLPGPFNMAFGEPLAYFGVLLLAGGSALQRGVSTRPLAVLGAFGGAAALVEAAAIAHYRLTMIPATSSLAFASVGLAALSFPLRGRGRFARTMTGLLFAAAGAQFALLAGRAIFHHLAPGSFDAWVPR